MDVGEEIDRVVPFVAEVRELHPGLLISVDIWRHEVGRRACEAGADLLDDTWGGADPKLVDVAAEFGAGYVCSRVGGMPVRTDPHPEPSPDRPFWPRYDDVVTEVVAELTAAAERAVAAGVPRGGVLVDPTFDFGRCRRLPGAQRAGDAGSRGGRRRGVLNRSCRRGHGVQRTKR